MQLADLRHRIGDRNALVQALQEVTRILHVDLASRSTIVQPGVINLDVTHAVHADGYLYAPDPSSQSACRHGIRVANVFHAGDGNLHPLIPYDAEAPGETARVMRASEEILAACVAAGGIISGEHGIGFEKNNYMPWIFSDADLDAQRRLKRSFDPDELMNPFKVFPTPVSCGALMARRPPRLSASGLWI